MEFEWDEGKRWLNLHKHGFDFRDAPSIFDSRARIDVESDRCGEPRTLSIALLEGRVTCVVWTERGDDNIRIISVRRARHAEERRYRQLFS